MTSAAGGEASDVLKEATIKVHRQPLCKARYRPLRHKLNEDQMCASSRGNDACQVSLVYAPGQYGSRSSVTIYKAATCLSYNVLESKSVSITQQEYILGFPVILVVRWLLWHHYLICILVSCSLASPAL